MRLAVPIPIDLPLQITCYVADAQAASMMERALEAPGSAWGPEVLGCRIQPMRGATCDFFATCDFWTLKRDSCIKRYPSGVCPSPARETAPGFSLRGRGAPQKAPWVFWASTSEPQTQSVFWPPPPRTPNPKTSRGMRRMPPISESPKRKPGRRAAGLAQPRDEHGAE